MHYVVILDWATEDCEAVDILAVKHNLEEAKKVFDEALVKERAYAEEHSFEIFEDIDTLFGAGEAGYWSTNHTKLYIQAVND